MTGETGFNEVLFEDARIPDANRLDDVGQGWTVAMTTLTYERGAAESAGGGGGGGQGAWALVELARRSVRDGMRAADDPVTRDAIVRSAANRQAQWVVVEPRAHHYGWRGGRDSNLQPPASTPRKRRDPER